MKWSRIPRATVNRLPLYLQCLESLPEDKPTVSSMELAERIKENAAKVRKDLSFLGTYGVRGVGYDVEHLIFQIRRELGLTRVWPVLIVGAGNLGSALAKFGGFGPAGFTVVALFDNDPDKVGTRIGDLTVLDVSHLHREIRDRDIPIAIIATPADGAQHVADRLVAAGVRSILNFAPIVLQAPSGVEVRQVDMATELQILGFHAQQARG